MEWVQKYIHLFGGDPSRVTLLGESAGGGSIEHHVTAYGGLKGSSPFQQVIVQSPGFLPLPSNNQQELTYESVLSYASLITGRTISTTAQLRTLSDTELYLTNFAVVGLSPYGSFTFGPTVDGSFVPQLPGELILHGQFDKTIKVMTGIYFTSPFIQDDTKFRAYIKSNVPSATDATIDYVASVLYPPNFNGSYGYTNQIERTAVLLSEYSFTCNTRYFATGFENNVYAYYFSVPPGLHGEDIAYTYFNGDTTTLNQGVAPVDATIAMALQDYITSFAMNGSPNEAGVPFFPLYGTNSTTTNLGASLGLQIPDTAANSRCAWWQKGLYY